MRSDEFEPIDPAWRESILKDIPAEPFIRFLGLHYEDVRREYARMRLPFRPELLQAGGVVHGGAIASLADTAGVGAVLSSMKARPSSLFTVDSHVQYLDSVAREDLIAEARVRRRGRTLVFVEVEVGSAGREAAHAALIYKVGADPQ